MRHFPFMHLFWVGVVVLQLGSGCRGEDLASDPSLKRQALLNTMKTELTVSALPADARFGQAVAVDGDTVVVGAPNITGSASQTGATYVFFRSASGWTQQAMLTASDETDSAWFGTAVGIDGDHLVVGACQQGNAGAAYVYTRTGSGASATWGNEVKLTAPNLASHDEFGRSVGISGDTIVVGANGDDDNGIDAGMVYVYVRGGGAWTEQATLPGKDVGELQGFSVAIDGETIIAGAPGYGEYDPNDMFQGDYTGIARIYTRSGSTWSEQSPLQQNPKQGYDLFGVSVSIHGDRAAVGAAYYEARGYVFSRSGTTWSQQLRTDPPFFAESEYACQVDIDGDLLVIGNSGMFGSAHIYQKNGASWVKELTQPGSAFGDGYAGAVAIDGQRFVVGADLSGAGGAALVYDILTPTPDAGVDTAVPDTMAPDLVAPDTLVIADKGATPDLARADGIVPEGGTPDGGGESADSATRIDLTATDSGLASKDGKVGANPPGSAPPNEGCGCAVQPATADWPALVFFFLLLVSRCKSSPIRRSKKVLFSRSTSIP